MIFMFGIGAVCSPDSENRSPKVWKSTVYPTEANNDPNNDLSPVTCNMRTRHANWNWFKQACSTQNFELEHTRTDHIWKSDTYPRDSKAPKKSVRTICWFQAIFRGGVTSWSQKSDCRCIKLLIYPISVNIGLKWPLGNFASFMLLIGVVSVIIRL